MIRKVRKSFCYLGELIMYGESKELKIALNHKYESILRFFHKIIPNKGVKVLQEEWDYLIILDACRFDDFQEINTLQGKLEKKMSRGSHTVEWLQENFRSYNDDVIYISANPQIACYGTGFPGNESFNGDDLFFKVEHVWDYGWNHEMDTVPPGQVTKAALEVRNMYPDKRMIIHYMQPHGPWIREIDPLNKHIKPISDDKLSSNAKTWKLAKMGCLDIVELRQAYRENLSKVLREVKHLIKQLSGRIVISADHGESFGENYIFEHPFGIHTKELLEVPWFIVSNSAKRYSERRGGDLNCKVDKKGEIDVDKVRKRLKNLGYT